MQVLLFSLAFLTAYDIADKHGIKHFPIHYFYPGGFE